MQILAVIDDDYFGPKYIEAARLAERFADIIWYRIKNKPVEEIREKAAFLKKKVGFKNTVLSERFDIACELGLAGVHLNALSEISYEEIKSVNKNMTVGYSAHSLQDCFVKKADYYVLSPIFFTPKPYEVKPLGAITVPQDKNIFALGGVTRDKAGLLKSKGFAGIAGIRLIEEYGRG